MSGSRGCSTMYAATSIGRLQSMLPSSLPVILRETHERIEISPTEESAFTYLSMATSEAHQPTANKPVASKCIRPQICRIVRNCWAWAARHLSPNTDGAGGSL